MGYPILRDAIVAVAGPAAVCAANELGAKYCDSDGHMMTQTALINRTELRG